MVPATQIKEEWPSCDDLKIDDADYIEFQKLADWQLASENSTIVLGKPVEYQE